MARLAIAGLVALTVLLGLKTAASAGGQDGRSGQGRGEGRGQTPPSQDNPTAGPTIPAAEFQRMMRDLSNWSRWGKDDQKGAVNLVTAAKRKEAAALVRSGVSVSMSHSPLTEKTVDNPSPFELAMLGRPGLPIGLDSWKVSHHGYTFSHLDALCHYTYDGKMYNGFAVSEITTTGCTKNGVEQMREGILTRGVLIDIPRLKGVPYLEAPTAVTKADVDAWLKKANIKVESGDAVFVRTGRWGKRAAVGPFSIQGNSAGLHVSALTLLKNIALAGSDVGMDVAPSGVEGQGTPVHTVLLVALGVPIMDNADLEALAETAARLNRWQFMLSVNPVAVMGGTGGLVNAIATF
jgi:kynurenine formamidase